MVTYYMTLVFSHLTTPRVAGTYPPGRKDLPSTFVLIVYRYASWMNDLAFLKEMYPKMMIAIEWELKEDRDGDGLQFSKDRLILHSMRFHIRVGTAYVSSVFIAAL